MADQRRRLFGIACGAGAGATWGLVFLAPELARGFSPIEQTIGRHLCYGLISALLLLPRWRVLAARLTRQDWISLALLALVGNTLYNILLATAVQTGGIAMTSLIVGFVPVAVTVIGTRDRDAVPLRRLGPSLALCAAGAICIGLQALSLPASGSATAQVTGLLCAVGAFLCWTSYAVINSRRLAHVSQVSGGDWSLLVGVMTGAQMILLMPLALGGSGMQAEGADWVRFIGISAGVAVLASILGNSLWNRMNRMLPLTLVGQMILFETMFALLYGFVWEQRFPTPLEGTAFAFVALGVVSCVAAHQAPRVRGAAKAFA